MKETPEILAAAASFVGSEQAMDEHLEALETLYAQAVNAPGQWTPAQFARSIEIVRSMHAIRNKSMQSIHLLLTALMQEVEARS